MRIWKGLYVSMWMSDKPLPQEQLAENIGSLVHAFERPTVAIEFVGAFLQTMAAEWFGIDQWRIDKFMMLVRRVIRQMLVLLDQNGWPVELLEKLNAELSSTVLRSSCCVGFFMHVTELWLEEVAKISKGDIGVEAVSMLVRPFGVYLARPRDPKLCRHVVKHVFNYLLYQSELGREYQERFEAWKSTGFAGNTIEAMERYEEEEEEEENDDDAVEEDEEDADDDDANESAAAEDDSETDDEQQHLDPRAGRVDVIMSEMPFDAEHIADQLRQELTKPYTNVKSRQQLTRVIDNYMSFAGGRFPLGIQEIRLKSDELEMPRIEDKVGELVQFEKNLRKQNELLKNLNKRNRKKLLAGKELPATALAAAAARRAKHLPGYGGAAADHEHDGQGCCGGHGQVKKRRSITPAEKAKIKQWQEEDIPETTAADDEATAERTPKVKKAKRASLTPSPDAAVAAESTPKAAKSASKSSATLDPWSQPLLDGEVEFSTPSRKRKLLLIKSEGDDSNDDSMVGNTSTASSKNGSTPSSARKVINPAALAMLNRTPSTPATPGSAQRRVLINLSANRAQEKSEYFKQLIASPSTPFDANRKPPKGVLKPNLMPSPINPYYKQTHGLYFE